MKNLRLIACLFVTTSMFGCALTTESATESNEKAIRIDNATVTHEGELSIISNDYMTISTLSLSLASKQGDTENLVSGTPDTSNAGVCCTNCNIFTGWCEECHTCLAE